MIGNFRIPTPEEEAAFDAQMAKRVRTIEEAPVGRLSVRDLSAPPPPDLSAEVAELRASHEELCQAVAELRASHEQLRASHETQRREIAELRRALGNGQLGRP
jgi:uncharacterized coiled-coil DUF342 family protein